MKWINATLYRKEQTGTDKLKNPVYEDKEVGNINIRITPWCTAMQIELGQEYLATHRKFITPSAADLFTPQHLCSVVINGEKYSAEGVKACGKFTSVTVRAVKQ